MKVLSDKNVQAVSGAFFYHPGFAPVVPFYGCGLGWGWGW